MREEPLGEDHRGRRYWFFYNDAARLWVEAPKGEVVERENGSTWAWAFYDTAAHVEMLINSLDGRGQVGSTCHGCTCYRMPFTTARTHSTHPQHAPRPGCTQATPRATSDAPRAAPCRGQAGEARLKSALKELQPVLSSTMVAEMAVNESDGWLESGHEWVGQPVLRVFPTVGPSTGKITKWLPADEEAGEGAIFHVVHDDDGDEEDLEEEDARAAIEAHRDQAEAGSIELEQPKYVNMDVEKRLRVHPHQLGVAGLRNELLDLEEMCARAPHVHVMGSARDGHVVSTACDAHCTRPGAPRPRVSALVLAPHPRARRGRLKDGLRRAHSNWDRPDGGRALWLTSCRDSECVNELAQLLISLEATVRAHITLILCFPRGHGALRGTPRPATLGVQAATQDLGCNPVCPSLRPECAQPGEHVRAGARAAEGRGHQRAAAVAHREHGARVHGRVRAPLL